MLFISCSLGKLSREKFIHYEQSSVTIERFRSSQYAEVLSQRVNINGLMVISISLV